MSFDKNGEYQGHTHEDDEYHKPLGICDYSIPDGQGSIRRHVKDQFVVSLGGRSFGHCENWREVT